MACATRPRKLAARTPAALPATQGRSNALPAPSACAMGARITARTPAALSATLRRSEVLPRRPPWEGAASGLHPLLPALTAPHRRSCSTRALEHTRDHPRPVAGLYSAVLRGFALDRVCRVCRWALGRGSSTLYKQFIDETTNYFLQTTSYGFVAQHG